MPRRARESMNTSFFHVIVQGVNKEYIFKKIEYKEKYLKLLRTTQNLYSVDIIAYCIMENHVHLLLHTEDTKKLSKFMKKINEEYGRYYNYIENRVGHIFRDRFLSEPITNYKYLFNCIAYIHNNPVKANIVHDCGSYRFSSYKDYINETGLIDKNIIKLVFGTEKLALQYFKELHTKSKYYFTDYEDNIEENIKEIIEDIEKNYNKEMKYLVQNQKYLREIVIEIKERIKISNRQLAKYLKVDQNKIYRIGK